MKKFVGLVNGKSFDNEKDFNEAAKKAIQANEENLSISSYYSYTEDSDKEEEVDEKEDTKYLPSSEYMIVSQEPELKDKDYVYSISDELTKKILEASNDGDIKDNANRLINLYKEQIKCEEEKMKVIEAKIENLQDTLYKKEDGVKKLEAKQEYYNNILNLLSQKEEEKKEEETPVEDEEHKTITAADVRKIFGSTSIYDALRQLGLFM